jgi:hypothetical protein
VAWCNMLPVRRGAADLLARRTDACARPNPRFPKQASYFSATAEVRIELNRSLKVP